MFIAKRLHKLVATAFNVFFLRDRVKRVMFRNSVKNERNEIIIISC